jgi:hypothetical protein
MPARTKTESLKDDLGFADALRRRLGPTWPPQQRCADGFRPRRPLRRCVDISVDRVVIRKGKYYFFFFFAFLAFFAFFAFFAILPSKAMSEWRCRNDAHPNRHAPHFDYYSNQ